MENAAVYTLFLIIILLSHYVRKRQLDNFFLLFLQFHLAYSVRTYFNYEVIIVP